MAETVKIINEEAEAVSSFPTFSPSFLSPLLHIHTYCPGKLFVSNPGHLGNEVLNKYQSERMHVLTLSLTHKQCRSRVKYRPWGRGNNGRGIGLHCCRASRLLVFVVGLDGRGKEEGGHGMGGGW